MANMQLDVVLYPPTILSFECGRLEIQNMVQHLERAKYATKMDMEFSQELGILRMC